MTSAVIVAGGQSRRMGGGIDKLFMETAGVPIVAHTWALFENLPVIDEIVLVVRAGLQVRFEDLARSHGFNKPYRVTLGGPERQDSVWNGLAAVSSSSVLAVVHDAARPATAAQTITATIEVARRVGAAVAGRRVIDTIKKVDGEGQVQATVDRSELWAVQTPQVFRVEVLREALSVVRQRGIVVTDDAAACEEVGTPVVLVEDAFPNPKVTVPQDLDYVGWLLGRARGSETGGAVEA